MISTDSKCKNCSDRYPGCHSKCKDFKDYKERMRRIKDNEKVDNLNKTYDIESIYRHDKRRK